MKTKELKWKLYPKHKPTQGYGLYPIINEEHIYAVRNWIKGYDTAPCDHFAGGYVSDVKHFIDVRLPNISEEGEE